MKLWLLAYLLGDKEGTKDFSFVSKQVMYEYGDYMRQDNSFESMLAAYARPTTERLQRALGHRRMLTTRQSNFIVYMSGFTHWNEFRSLFRKFHIESFEGFPCIIEKEAKRIHFKILVQDLSEPMSILAPSILAREYSSTIFHNSIQDRTQEGDYQEDYRQPFSGESFTQYEEYLLSHKPGLSEDVAQIECESPKRINRTYAFHIAFISHRNRPMDMDRIFNRVSAVVSIPTADDSMNLAFRQLSGFSSIQPSLSHAEWFIYPNEYSHLAKDFASERAARYVFLPRESRRDIVDTVLSRLIDRYEETRI